MQKFGCWSVIFFIGTLLLPPLLGAQIQVTILPAEITVLTVGERFTVDVRVNRVENLYGFQFDLRFNKDGLKVVDKGVQEGGFLKQGGEETYFAIAKGIRNDAGFIAGITGTRLRRTTSVTQPNTGDAVESEVPVSVKGVSGTGVLAAITFEVLDDNLKSPLELENLVLVSPENNIPAKGVSAVVIPNHPPEVVSLSVGSRVSGGQPGDLSINYTLNDRENEPLSLVYEYSADGGSSWRSPTVEGETRGITRERYTGTVIWHSRTDLPSTSGMDVRFRLTPKDAQRTGTPAVTTPYRLVNLLGDYDDDRDVDFDDLALFSKAWREKTVQKELGPATGKVPDLIPAFDGKFDFEDLAVFILMWNWSAKQKPPATPAIASIIPAPNRFQPDLALQPPVAPSLVHRVEITLAEPIDGFAARFTLNFDPETVEVSQVTQGNLWQDATTLFLHRVDNERGTVDIQLARLDEDSGRNTVPHPLLSPVHSCPPAHGGTIGGERPQGGTRNAVAILNVEKRRGAPASLRLDSGELVAFALNFDLRDGFNREIASGQKHFQWRFEPLPKVTQLLQNYPNPFNPETWVPYQLAADGAVTIQIFGMDGQRVRTLTLGWQKAGRYLDRPRAAYWDGRNDRGEWVASGVYFYTLHAGSFTATRKLIVVR
ncbi:T9SS type A sorting domain-containing protein [Candidatus Poribacteria bacterium]|nr:T9SS type A sorting domain-containing protein [Candidatus Poribacteria bacterium]